MYRLLYNQEPGLEHHACIWGNQLDLEELLQTRCVVVLSQTIYCRGFWCFLLCSLSS